MTQSKRNNITLVTLILLISLLMFLPVKVHAAGGYSISDKIFLGINSDKTFTPGKTVSIDISELENCIPGFTEAYAFGTVSIYRQIYSKPDFGSENIIRKQMISDLATTIPETDAGRYYVLYVNGKSSDYSENLNTNSVFYQVKAASPGGGSSSTETKLSLSGISKTGILTIKGTAPSDLKYVKLYIDGTNTRSIPDYTGTTFTYKLDVKDFSLGSHTLEAELSNGEIVKYGSRFPTYIYDSPGIKKSEIQTYGKYLLYTPSKSTKYDGYCLCFRKKGTKTWYSTSPATCVHGYATMKLGSLKPNTTYEVRSFYSKEITQNGSSFYITGNVTDSYSKTITVKTGPKAKPPVKSIKISGAKLKKVWVKPKTYWDKGSKSWKTLKGFYAYETTFKVTVTMKKKPGCAGIFIGKKYVKGNKKTYTATFTEGGKWKGKKISVAVYSKGNKSYGAYSPTYKKKVTVK